MPFFVPWVSSAAGRLVRSGLGLNRPSSPRVNPAEPESPVSVPLPTPAQTFKDRRYSKLRMFYQNNDSHFIGLNYLGNETEQKKQEQDRASVCIGSVIQRSHSGSKRVKLPPLNRPSSLRVNSAEPVLYESPVIVPLPPKAQTFKDRRCSKLGMFYQNNGSNSTGLDCLGIETEQVKPEQDSASVYTGSVIRRSHSGSKTVMLPPLSLHLSLCLCPGVIFLVNSLRGLEAVFARVRITDFVTVAENYHGLTQDGASSPFYNMAQERIVYNLTKDYTDSAFNKVGASISAMFTMDQEIIPEFLTIAETNGAWRIVDLCSSTLDAAVSVLANFFFFSLCLFLCFFLSRSILGVMRAFQRLYRKVSAAFSMNRIAQLVSRGLARIAAFFSRAD